MNIKDFVSEIPKEIKQGVAIALVIIFLFSSGNVLGSILSADKQLEDYTVNAEGEAPATTAPTTAAPTTAAPTTAAPTTAAPTTAAPTTAAPSGDATTAAPTTATPSGDATTAPTTAAPSTGAPSTKAEIVAYYTDSANKIKTAASSVTRNYEDLRHDTDKLQLPGALQSAGEKLISTFLKKNETPETYTGADIAAKFPIPGESWVSKLTEADVAEATCTDNGTQYEITIKANTQADPSLGSGVGAGFEIIKSEDVMNAAGFIVKSFNTEYYDCVVKCKVDKATGNMVSVNFTTPIIMKVDTKLGISAQVGMTFEKDYTIAY